MLPVLRYPTYLLIVGAAAPKRRGIQPRLGQRSMPLILSRTSTQLERIIGKTVTRKSGYVQYSSLISGGYNGFKREHSRLFDLHVVGLLLN